VTLATQRLNEGIRATLVAHFLALPMKDRRLRFGTALAPAVIATYVDGIDFIRGAVFGVHDDRLALVGVAHVAIEDDLAEVALSVLPMHRGRGVGSALFKRAVAHACNRCVPRLFMIFRSENAPIMRIAQRFGMRIVARGGEARAVLALQHSGQVASDSVALAGVMLENSPDSGTVGQPTSDSVVAPIDTHWSRILYCDLFSARADGSTPDLGELT
jgi:GNAT superfamily N-acetyltransferase